MSTIASCGVQMSENIFLAEDDDQIRGCYPVMLQLRPHVEPDEFLARVKRQREIAGYELVYITDRATDGAADGARKVKAVAGFRISESLAWGKFLYVDDLVSKSDERSKGYGGALFDWLVQHAKENNCDQFHLDSGVQRFAAHRFYLAKRMNIECHHFGLQLQN
jgi:GNAT superfamily N-acetyltransferase